MMEFLYSCYLWVAENYEKILLTISSAQFVSLISSLVLLYKTIKSSKDNTASSKALNEALTNTNAMSADVVYIKEENETLKAQNKELADKLESLQKDFTSAQEKLNSRVADGQETLLKKLNSMIEVQSIVYSTIRDETVRNTVNSILVHAKYDEPKDETKAKLKEQIEALKSKLEEKTEEVKNISKQATENIEKIIEPDPTATVNNFKRY